MKRSIKNGLIAAAAVATVGTVGLVGVQATHAASDTNSATDPMSSLVDKIASKFNLNKTDVQKVFDENRTEMDAKREAEVSTRLQKLVDAGTITSDQKTKIEAKLKELKAAHESNKDSTKSLSDAGRKAKMDAEKTALDAWAKDNNLNLTKLEGVFRGPGMGHGPGGQR